MRTSNSTSRGKPTPTSMFLATDIYSHMGTVLALRVVTELLAQSDQSSGVHLRSVEVKPKSGATSIHLLWAIGTSTSPFRASLSIIRSLASMNTGTLVYEHRILDHHKHYGSPIRNMGLLQGGKSSLKVVASRRANALGYRGRSK